MKRWSSLCRRRLVTHRATCKRSAEARLDTVLVLEPVRDDFELQLADRADSRSRARAGRKTWIAPSSPSCVRPAQLLGAQRVGDLDALEDLGREERQSGELERLSFGQRVAELQHAVVGHADHVAGVSLVEQLAALRQKCARRLFVRSSFPVRHLQLHPALEAARAHAHERDAVAVRRIHVRLDLEDDAA